ncbi:MAG: phosphoribosylanthranilate isomerase [Acidimicrobiales bacterium]
MTEFAARGRLVKICGVTSVGDALMVRDAGADALGVIFAPSARRVDEVLAREIVDASDGIVHVGVFRDDETAFVVAMADASGVDVVQVHGPLDETLLKELRRRRLGVIKALSVGTEEFFEFDETRVDAILIDGIEPGSGREHSWDALRERHFDVPVIAAGGLKPDNVFDVIKSVRPWGVDVATGVESAPGVKDPARVTKFVQKAASAWGRGGET